MGRPRKTAESTGTFPPTPTLEMAARDASATNDKEPPIAIPNTPPMNNVRLNDHLRGKSWIREGIQKRVRYPVNELSAPDIATKTPEDGADEQAYVRGKRQERLVEVELIYGRGENQPSHKLHDVT
jgi:hypothetical protein